jgi:hypothetical protein
MCPPPIDLNSIVHWLLTTTLGISGVMFAILLLLAMRNSKEGRKWLLVLSLVLTIGIFVINVLLDVCHKIENKAMSAKEVAMEIVEATAMEIAEKWEQLIGLARRAKDWFDNRAATAKKNYAQCLEDKVARIDQISHTGTCAAFLACNAANTYLSDAWFVCAEPIASNVDPSGALECKTKEGPQIINSDAPPKPHVLCVPQ